MQTDAEIGPGNSGGLAADKDGRLIGVPTQVRSDPSIVGVTRGRLRPIDIAKRVIDAARTGKRYKSPYFVSSSGREKWELRSWAAAAPASGGCAFSPITSYPPSPAGLTPVWDVNGMKEGEDVRFRWLYLSDAQDQEPDVLGDVPDVWKKGWPSSLRCVFFSYSAQGGSIDGGRYVAAVLAGPNLRVAGSSEVNVETGAQPPVSGTRAPARVAPVSATSESRPAPGARDCPRWDPKQIVATGVDLPGAALPNGTTIAESGRIGLTQPIGDSGGYETLDEADRLASDAVYKIFGTKFYRWMVLRHSGRYYAFEGRIYEPVSYAPGAPAVANPEAPPCRILRQDAEVVAWHALSAFQSLGDVLWERYDWSIDGGGGFSPFVE